MVPSPLKEEWLVVITDGDQYGRALTGISEIQGPQPSTPVRHLQATELAQGHLLDL